MAITDDTKRIPIEAIWVNRDRRQRRLIETSSLERSIAIVGLLQPIVITRELELKAGERRWTACKNLGHKDILCRFIDSLDEIEAQIVELEENLFREDLSWQESVRAVGNIHQLYLQHDKTWTQEETANAIGLTPGHVSRYLSIFSVIEDERISKAGTWHEAYNIVLRRRQRLAGEQLQELLEEPNQPGELLGLMESPEGSLEPKIDTGGKTLVIVGESRTTDISGRVIKPPDFPFISIQPKPQPIVHQSFLDWAPSYSGPKFNFVHCDFPYGTNLFGGKQGAGADAPSVYEDTPEVYFELLESFCLHLDRFMSISAHLVFWYSEKFRQQTLETFARLAPSLSFSPHPLIWFKSNNDGISPDPRRLPRHVYETALFASRGSRQLVGVKADCYAGPTDRSLHVSTKPEPMLRHFFEMIVDENTIMLDPTCGSGAALRAAESLRAKFIFGMDSDEKCVEVARQALKTFRLKRGEDR